MYTFFEIHRIVFVILDFPLFLSKSKVHLSKNKISVIAVSILWHVEYHVIVSTYEISWCAVVLF